MQQSTHELDIVLPCYNPAEGWAERAVQSFSNIVSLLPDVSIGLILVNDGSTSGLDTALLNELKRNIPQFTYIELAGNRGKGAAVREGMKRSDALFAIFTDIDFPYEEESLVKVYRTLKAQQADLVIGKRQTTYYRGVPRMRRWISRLLKGFIRLALGIPETDTQAGLKGFSREGRKLLLSTTIDRYLFDLELVTKAYRGKKIKVAICPIQLKAGVRFSSVGRKVLLQEAGNFWRILWAR